MGNASAIVFSGIAPHPPIMVPEVGREAIAEVRGSIAAMAELTSRIIHSGAETVVIISPHAPLSADAFVSYHSQPLHGDFATFRAEATTVEFPLDDELLGAIVKSAAAQNYEVPALEEAELDHGTGVPLYFLDRNGWQGRVVALGYSFLGNEDHLKFGECIREAAENIGRPVAFIASGDLSHRLKPEAPAGYNPSAHLLMNKLSLRWRETHQVRSLLSILICAARPASVAIAQYSSRLASRKLCRQLARCCIMKPHLAWAIWWPN